MSTNKGFSGLTTGNSTVNKIDFAVRRIMSELWTVTLGQVVTVDESNNTVDVRPMVQQVDGNRNVVEQAILYNIPFIRVQGGLNAFITNPQAGDIGLLAFAMRDISSVKESKKATVPPTDRSYDPADALYIGGLLNGTPKRFVKITDTGIEIEGVENVHIHGNNTTIQAADTTVNATNVRVKATTKADIEAPALNLKGATTVDGDLLVKGGIAWTQNAAPPTGVSSLKFNGNVEISGQVSGTQVKAGNITLTGHRHVDSEGGNTGTPIA